MNIKEIRKKYPQYKDVSDTELAKALHAESYSDIPFVEFANAIGLNAPESVANEYGPMDAFNVSAGRTMDRIFSSGPKQAYYGAASLVSDDAKKQLDALKAEQEQNTAHFAELQKKHPYATFFGGAAPYFMAPNIPTMLAGALMEYGTPKEKAVNAGLTLVGGGAAKAVGKTAGPASMGNASNKFDIPLTRGQQSGNRMAQEAEAVVEHLPFGGPVRKARDKTTEAFWRAVSKQFGENSGRLTPQLLGQARERIGNEIGNIAARNKIAVDQQLFKDLQAVASRAETDLVAEEAALVKRQIQSIWKSMDPTTGTIPGTLYKATQRKLGELAKNGKGTISDVFGDVRTAYREAMTRSVSPDDANDWAIANERYFNLMQVAEATKRTPGEMSPAALLMQVNKSQKNAKFGGGNELAELAQFAQQHIGNKVPNSGTAQRLFWQNLLGDGPAGVVKTIGMGAAAPITYPAARFLAGKPLSPSTQNLLERIGGAGLLGLAPPQE